MGPGRTLHRSNQQALIPTVGSPERQAPGPQGGEGSLMRPYEAMFVLDPAMEESAVQAVINRSTAQVESSGGTVNRVDKWGKRRLAYEIQKKQEGYYVLMTTSAEPATMDELERNLRLADDVIRHKIVRIPDNAGGRTLPPSAIEELMASGRRGDRGERGDRGDRDRGDRGDRDRDRD